MRTRSLATRLAGATLLAGSLGACFSTPAPVQTVTISSPADVVGSTSSTFQLSWTVTNSGATPVTLTAPTRTVVGDIISSAPLGSCTTDPVLPPGSSCSFALGGSALVPVVDTAGSVTVTLSTSNGINLTDTVQVTLDAP